MNEPMAISTYEGITLTGPNGEVVEAEYVFFDSEENEYYDTHTLTIKPTNFPITISGTNEDMRIVLDTPEAGITETELILNGVTAKMLNTSSIKTTLTLADGSTNTFESSKTATVQSDGSELIINGDTGILNATTTTNQPAIGSATSGQRANITIDGGVINASQASYSGAPVIGGSEGVDITINGGTINATSNIGGGASATIGVHGNLVGDDSNITITGGDITVSGVNTGVLIGTSGDSGEFNMNIDISGGTINATTNTSYSSAIGGYKSIINIKDTANVTASAVVVGIGGVSSIVNITDGTVTAENSGVGIGGSGAEVNISGGDINATGTRTGAGIGGTSHGSKATVNIYGGNIVASGSSGIGSGYNASATVTILGGNIDATSIYDSTDADVNRHAYGIGYGGGYSVSITDTTFSTTATVDGNKIIGDAFIVANSYHSDDPGISDESDKENWSGVIFNNSTTGEVYGSPTLNADATIPENHELTFTDGSTLAIANGVVLTNEGTLTIESDANLDATTANLASGANAEFYIVNPTPNALQVDVTSPSAGASYTGAVHTPTSTLVSPLTIYGQDFILSQDTGWAFSEVKKGNVSLGKTPEITDAGTYSFVYANATNSDTKNVDFVIAPKALDTTGTYRISFPEVTYTGEALTPKVSIEWTNAQGNIVKLIEGTDFSVVYSDNISGGQATVALTDLGNYGETANATFTINKIEDKLNANVDSQEHSYGEEVTLTATITVLDPVVNNLLRTGGPGSLEGWQEDMVYFFDEDTNSLLGGSLVSYVGTTGTATLVYNTVEKGFQIGSNHILEGFSGNTNMKYSETYIDVNLKEKEIDAFIAPTAAALKKVVDGSSTFTLSVDLDGICSLTETVNGEEVITRDLVDPLTATITLSSSSIGTYDASQFEVAEISDLSGDHAEYYKLDKEAITTLIETLTFEIESKPVTTPQGGATISSTISSSKTETAEVTPESTPGSTPNTSATDVGTIFKDVATTDWFSDAVQYVYENQLMIGISDDLFAPNTFINRASTAQILWNLSEQPSFGTLENPYTDVTPNAWYTNTVLWATENNLFVGYTDGTFQPGQNITREEFVILLWRHYGQPTPTNLDLSRFNDAHLISEYATEAMAWAVEEGIIFGTQNNQLNAKNNTTRAEVAAIIARYCENQLLQ